METVIDFLFLGSKISADSDCSHEINKHLLLGRKPMTNLDGILKSRVITLPTKVHLVKAMVFPVVIYWCESQTIKTVKHQIDAFELWCWRRPLRVPWLQGELTNKFQRKSVLNIHWKDWCWTESPIFWPPTAKNWLIGKDPDSRKEWMQEDRGWQRMRWLNGITRWTWVWASTGSCWWRGKPGLLQSMGSQRVGHDWVTEVNWTDVTLNKPLYIYVFSVINLEGPTQWSIVVTFLSYIT